MHDISLYKSISSYILLFGRYTAILSAMMTLLGTRAAAMKGCYVALSATAIASAAAPSVARLAAEKLSLEDELYSHLPWALWGYVGRPSIHPRWIMILNDLNKL